MIKIQKARLHDWILLGTSIGMLAACFGGLLWIREQQAATAAIHKAVADQSIPLRKELIRLKSRLETLQVFFAEAEETEREARFLAGLDVDAHQPLAVPTARWNTDAELLEDDNYRDLQLLIATTMGISQMATKAQHTAASYDDIARSMTDQAPAWAGIPSISPIRHARQTSNFGRRRDPFTGERRNHYGVDLAGPYGTAVYASAAGRVRLAGWVGAFGRFVEIDHGNGIRTRYAHNSKLLVRAGEWVRRGQVIARLGSSGRASAPHLHYEVLVDGRAKNPGYVSGSPITAE